MLKKIPKDFHATLLGKQIMLVPSVRDLSKILDSTLTYNEHVTIVVLKCTANLCQINRVKTYLISGNCEE